MNEQLAAIRQRRDAAEYTANGERIFVYPADVDALLAMVDELERGWSAEHDAYIRTDEQLRMMTRERDALREQLQPAQLAAITHTPQAPQVSWSNAPAFAMWWAADEDGNSVWFEAMPTIARDDKGGYWDNPSQAATRRAGKYWLNGYDWTKTLQGRPGVIDMRAAEMGIDAQY